MDTKKQDDEVLEFLISIQNLIKVQLKVFKFIKK